VADVQSSEVSGRSSGQAPDPGAVSQAEPRRQNAGYSTMVEDGFSGWGWFTGGLMGLIGLFQIITGIVALAGPGYYTTPPRTLVVDASYTTWGWVHLILGLVMLVTGGGLAFGNTIARVVGVALAVISAVVNLAFIPAAPFAAVLIIAFDVFLVYAITVHGGEPRTARR